MRKTSSALLAVLLAVPALASPAAARETVTSFRHVTAVGVTKPAGATLDGRLGTRPDLEAERARLGRLVRTAVCSGC